MLPHLTPEYHDEYVKLFKQNGNVKCTLDGISPNRIIVVSWNLDLLYQLLIRLMPWTINRNMFDFTNVTLDDAISFVSEMYSSHCKKPLISERIVDANVLRTVAGRFQALLSIYGRSDVANHGMFKKALLDITRETRCTSAHKFFNHDSA